MGGAHFIIYRSKCLWRFYVREWLTWGPRRCKRGRGLGRPQEWALLSRAETQGPFVSWARTLRLCLGSVELFLLLLSPWSGGSSVEVGTLEPKPRQQDRVILMSFTSMKTCLSSSRTTLGGYSCRSGNLCALIDECALVCHVNAGSMVRGMARGELEGMRPHLHKRKSF